MWMLNKLSLVAGLALTLAACNAKPETNSLPFANGRPVGEIRGTSIVNAQIQQRVLSDASVSTDRFQIERVAGNEVYSLRAILGEYSEGSAHADFHGGEPNPFGMLLWHQVAARFAEGLGATCSNQGTTAVNFFGDSGFQLSDSFAAALSSNCQPSAVAAEAEADAKKLWRAYMGIGASAEETPFVEFFTSNSSEVAGLSGSDRVSAMVLSMTLNPHFLLEK